MDTRRLAFVLLTVTACAPSAKQVAAKASSGATEGAIQQLNRPENKEDIAGVLADPKVREASEALAHSLVGAALDESTDEARLMRVKPVFESYFAAFGAKTGGALVGAVARQVPDLTDAMLSSLSSPRAQEK